MVLHRSVKTYFNQSLFIWLIIELCESSSSSLLLVNSSSPSVRAFVIVNTTLFGPCAVDSADYELF